MIEYAPSNDRCYGVVYLGKDATGENIAAALVAEGLAEVRRVGIRADKYAKYVAVFVQNLSS